MPSAVQSVAALQSQPQVAVGQHHLSPCQVGLPQRAVGGRGSGGPKGLNYHRAQGVLRLVVMDMMGA